MTTQAVFARALLDADGPVPEGLTDPAGRPAGKRFDVYRNTVVSTLSAALAEGFPAIRSLLGEEYFTALSGLYVRADLPSDPRLMLYGAGFAAFLNSFPPLANLPYLGDVARLELAIRESYHAADHVPFDPAKFAALDETALSALRLDLAPSVRLLRSEFPVTQIRARALSPDAPKPVGGAEEILVARIGFDPAPRRLPAGALTFLEALRAGDPLADAADLATGKSPDFDLTETLSLALTCQILLERPDP